MIPAMTGSAVASAFDPLRTLARAAASSRPAGFPCLLNRRAWHISVGAKDAAIASERAQHRAAMLAVVEELARIDGHRLCRDATALRASNGRG